MPKEISSRFSKDSSFNTKNTSKDSGAPLLEHKYDTSYETKYDGHIETDRHRLEARQKAIDKGKNTIGYDTYIKKVPIAHRKRGDPVTPDKNIKQSKRAWEGRMRVWRVQLHEYDDSVASDPASKIENDSKGSNKDSAWAAAKSEFAAASKTVADSGVLTPCELSLGSSATNAFTGLDIKEAVPVSKGWGDRMVEDDIDDLL